ncbi:MAG: flagellar hook protein FlgE [Desulfomonilia bacterium]
MGISSSLYSGISGLSVMSEAMSVIGDNIANVNTIGYKSSSATFQDVLAQSVATASGTSQVGRGTQLGVISPQFVQGSFQSTSNATDLAIGGNGFFIVSPKNENTAYYTRAGQFQFDSQGNFVNSSGDVVQGWGLDTNGNDVGTLKDIKLDTFTSPPSATSKLTAITNLDSTATSNADSLFAKWAGTDPVTGTDSTSPIADTSYGYSTTVQVYDSQGNSHDVTIYYDKLSAASEYGEGTPDTNNSWEYIVTCKPSDDLRAGFVGTAQKGVLMRGTLTFDATTGDISSVSAFTDDSGANPALPANWTEASFSADGYPEYTTQFVSGVDQTVSLETGIRSTSGTWNAGGAANVGAITALAPLPTSTWQPEAQTSTQYAASSTTTYQTQDGYGPGFLNSISVDTKGIMSGSYSNGQILKLFRVGLAKFNDQQALTKVGNSLWSANSASGDAITGHPGDNGLGSISSDSLEQSNVDIATEFVNMITTQRGYEANSKVITTVDTMLQDLIQIIR